jgi:hypothetical protein
MKKQKLMLVSVLTLSALALSINGKNYLARFFEDPPCLPPFCDVPPPNGGGGGGGNINN